MTCSPKSIAASSTDLLANLSASGADWGIWIDNGLVNPGETVRMTVSTPLSVLSTDLPAELEVHPRYLEASHTAVEHVRLKWKKIPEKNRWQALVKYQPRVAGNYYAAIQLGGHEIYSYFAAWKPGVTAVNFWMQMPAEYHDSGNLKDLYLPEAKSGHLPFDYELVLVGELPFKADWEPRDLFRHAQVEAGAEVVPFLDGGYFHKLDPEFTGRFESITDHVDGYENLISKETQAVHGFKKLPDPTFHSLSVDQSSAIIEGAQRYWKEWGFHPFTGVATYSPSNTLVESCRSKGLTWISGVFADYDFTDGGDRWEVGWRQKHRGMPSFPYLISKTDYRWTGKADAQFTMIFPGWQNLPVFDHEDRHEEGTDLGTYNGSSGLSPVQRMMLFSQVFERDNRLASNSFPLAETFCIQMNNPNNRPTLNGLIDRARQGGLIFIHKRYLQIYYREHHIKANPDICYSIPDAEIMAGHSTTYSFSDEAVWEGSDGKAAFISDPTAPLPNGRSVHLPVWWYDFRNAAPLSPQQNLPSVDLSNVTLDVVKTTSGTSLVIQSPKAIDGLPICLWDLAAGTEKSAAWVKANRAMRVAAPERMGADTVMWIIHPAIRAGKTSISLP
ncbi:hypothetical protein [Capsulimonas sp.]|uniref:hypothetical protein n=1 Tax=Capsulimonas sp. TaxID=2494211 RepID=UPI00326395C4